MGYGTQFPSSLDLERERRRKCAMECDVPTKKEMGRVDWADETYRRTQSVNKKQTKNGYVSTARGKGQPKT